LAPRRRSARMVQIPLVISTAIYVAVNLYLWTLHQSQIVLLLQSAPLGLVYFLAFFWYVMRTSD
jgi:uncharacterized membrane protein